MMRQAVRRIALALVALGAEVAFGVNFPTGTYVVAGSVRRADNSLYTSDDFKDVSEDQKVVVQAVAANGNVLAESQITDPYANASSGVNCFLRIPISLTPTEKTAAVGDKVNIVLKQGDETDMATSPLTIARANAVTGLVMKIAAVYTYTNQQDKSWVVTVSKEYVDGLEGWYPEDVTEYDPFADWDGDGSINYAEYVNGTDPNNANDYLKITEAKMTADGNFLIKFSYTGGHVYGVDATKALGSQASWSKKKLKTSEDGKEQLAVTYPGTDEDVDIATIYLVPASKTNEFFRVGGR